MNTRSYTTQYHKLYARGFKPQLEGVAGQYLINGSSMSKEHRNFKLVITDNGLRVACFTINGKEHQIALLVDNSSASTKLYISCPYCQKKKQHLYITAKTFICRQCLGIHYACQSERPRDRLMRAIRNKRKSIWGAGWDDVNNLFAHSQYWPKPKGIHWKTFNRMKAELDQLEEQYWPMVDIYLKGKFGADWICDQI